MAPGQAAWDSLASGRCVGHRGSAVACSGALELQHESCFWLQVLGSARGRRGLCCSQRARSHTGTRGAAVPGAGGSWDGPGLLQLASLEPIQAEQGLCCRCGGLTRSSEPDCCCPFGRTGRSLSGVRPPSLGTQRSLSYPFKASGTYCAKQGERKRPSPS